MRLHPRQKDVDVYQVGFGEDDLLQRKGAGKRLSDLLENVEDPVVLAVDGPWGSGKSYFLKRWVGAHTIENGGKATTVYFDAFAHDFLDDPLIALTGAIGERLPPQKSNASWKRAKTVAVKLARPVLRIGAAVATAGASEAVGPILDAAIEAGGKEAEKAAEEFWRREDGKRAAMQQFRVALVEITKDDTPLIIVVDELDRCRPDYALSLLETMKHFFAVERVHFVLGVNSEALEQIVQVRYGAGINATDYLKRFISLSMQLPKFVGNDASVRSQAKYLEAAAADMGVHHKITETLQEQLAFASESVGVSLRDIERMLTRIVLLPKGKELPTHFAGYQIVIVSLIIWQVLKPEFFRRALNKTLTILEIKNFFGFKAEVLVNSSESYNHDAYILTGVWMHALTGESADLADQQSFAKLFSNYGRDTSKVLQNIERTYFSQFEVVSDQ